MPKRHNGLESPTVFILITYNKFDFYNITDIADKKYKILDRALKNVIVKRIFTIHQLAHFLIIDIEQDLKKYQSKLLVIIGNFSLLTLKSQTKTKAGYLLKRYKHSKKRLKILLLLYFLQLTCQI